MGLIRNLSITLLYELFLCKDSITFRVFYVGNKKLYDSINEHFDNSVNISDYGVIFFVLKYLVVIPRYLRFVIFRICFR